jgi:hypothetical protein
MLEEKKEDRKVIITGQELDKYFGADKSPKEIQGTGRPPIPRNGKGKPGAEEKRGQAVSA